MQSNPAVWIGVVGPAIWDREKRYWRDASRHGVELGASVHRPCAFALAVAWAAVVEATRCDRHVRDIFA